VCSFDSLLQRPVSVKLKGCRKTAVIFLLETQEDFFPAFCDAEKPHYLGGADRVAVPCGLFPHE